MENKRRIRRVEPNTLAVHGELTRFNDATTSIRWSDVAAVKNRAFAANYRAKASTGQERGRQYREKSAAINYLLEIGMAFVDSVDWSVPDALFGVTFVDGGQLHVRLSCLNAAALRSVRRQLNGHPTPVFDSDIPDYGMFGQWAA